MKKSIKNIIFLFLFLSLSAFSKAQQSYYKYAVNLNSGYSYFLNTSEIKIPYLSTKNISFQAEILFNLTNSISLSLGAKNEKYYAINYPNQNLFSINNCAYIDLYLWTDNNIIFSKNAFISPYLSAGLGISFLKNNTSAISHNYIQTIPLSIGLKYLLTDRMNAFTSLNANYFTKNYFEPNTSDQNKFNNSTLGFFIGLSWNFGQNNKSYKSPIIYSGNSNFSQSTAKFYADDSLNKPKFSEINKKDSLLLTKNVEKIDSTELSFFATGTESNIPKINESKIIIKKNDSLIQAIDNNTDSISTIISNNLEKDSNLVISRQDSLNNITIKDTLNNNISKYTIQSSAAKTNENKNVFIDSLPSNILDSNNIANNQQEIKPYTESNIPPNLSNYQLLNPDDLTKYSNNNQYLEQKPQNYTSNPLVVIPNKSDSLQQNLNKRIDTIQKNQENYYVQINKKLDSIISLLNPPNNIDSNKTAEIIISKEVQKTDTVYITKNNDDINNKSLDSLNQLILANNKKINQIQNRVNVLQDSLEILKEAQNKTKENIVAPIDLEIYYKTGIYEVTDNSKISELEKIANFLKQNEQSKLLIQGFSDLSGNSQLNMKLSQKRANNVANYFEQKGILKQRIKVEYFGDTQSTKPNNPFDRKVVVKIIK